MRNSLVYLLRWALVLTATHWVAMGIAAGMSWLVWFLFVGVMNFSPASFLVVWTTKMLNAALNSLVSVVWVSTVAPHWKKFAACVWVCFVYVSLYLVWSGHHVEQGISRSENFHFWIPTAVMVTLLFLGLLQGDLDVDPVDETRRTLPVADRSTVPLQPLE